MVKRHNSSPLTLQTNSMKRVLCLSQHRITQPYLLSLIWPKILNYGYNEVTHPYHISLVCVTVVGLDLVWFVFPWLSSSTTDATSHMLINSCGGNGLHKVLGYDIVLFSSQPSHLPFSFHWLWLIFMGFSQFPPPKLKCSFHFLQLSRRLQATKPLPQSIYKDLRRI